MRILTGASIAVLFASGLGIQASAAGTSCEGLASMALPNATITSASVVAAGAFTPSPTPAPPGGPPAGGQLFRDLPAFCRVAATLKPSSDSEIKVEVWMPASGWNGKFQAVGNGGWAGVISYPAMAAAVRRGYATASTDTGHTGNGGDASFAFNHPEKLVDFAYRAVHEMTVDAKAVINQHYGNAPRLSYWNGCSTGGRQGLKEAQKFPADFDGIIAGAPANYMTHLLSHSIWVAQASLKDPSSLIPREKFAAVHTAALDACDTLDGVKDGVIEDPTRCRFDPKTIQCTGPDAPSCLTAPQVETARRIYAPATTAKGEVFFPGLEPGSEPGWMGLAGPAPLIIAETFFKFEVFKNPNWDFKTLAFDKDVAMLDKRDNGLLNAIDPNLKPFFSRGGKLLMYHGWVDQLIAPRNSINYYTSVAKAMGGADKAVDSIRLFMVPGMAHCAGGDGTSTFDAVGALEQWVEQKKAPAQIPASHTSNGVADRTRPLCLYPAVAAYKGSGDTNDAANFTCK
jgi:tannase/feruloyl esterase